MTVQEPTIREEVPTAETLPDGPPEDGPGPSGEKKVDWGRYGRGPMLLLAGVGLVDAIDKGILPGVLTQVQDDLGFSDFQLGMLEFAFIIATFLVIVPAGYLADRANRTRVISVVLGSWAVISAITAGVQNFIQFFGVRAALGVGETIDDPASSSLVADYYPARIRGRAYSYLRVTPTVGRALGTIFGGIVAAVLGWRWAFLLVGIPGSLLAIAVWRMKEPKRGEADLRELGTDVDVDVDEQHQVIDRSTTGDLAATAENAADVDEVDPDRIGFTEIFADIPRIVRIPSLRALLVGFAVASGALSGIGFWAVAFNERHSDLNGGAAAAVTGIMILLGAIIGTLVGGRIADRVRDSSPGAPMVAAAVGYVVGGIFLTIGLFDVPVWTVRLPAHTIGVAFVVGGFPATYAMISEVVPGAVRGQAFAASRFLSGLIGAFSPPLIGLTADQFQFELDGRMVGNLALAFGLFMPFLFVGAFYLYRGRVHVQADRAAAEAQTLAQYGFGPRNDDDPDGPDDDGPGGGGGSPDGDGPGAGGAPADESRGTATSPDTIPDATTPVAFARVPEDEDPVAFARVPEESGGRSVTSRLTAARERVARVSPRARLAQAREVVRVAGTPQLLTGGGALSAAMGTVLVGVGWYGASGASQPFDQLPFAISGGLLGVALIGLGAVLVVIGRILATASHRETELADARAALDTLRTRLLGS